jgi:hypothetical protein
MEKGPRALAASPGGSSRGEGRAAPSNHSRLADRGNTWLGALRACCASRSSNVTECTSACDGAGGRHLRHQLPLLRAGKISLVNVPPAAHADPVHVVMDGRLEVGDDELAALRFSRRLCLHRCLSLDYRRGACSAAWRRSRSGSAGGEWPRSRSGRALGPRAVWEPLIACITQSAGKVAYEGSLFACFLA